MNATNNLLLEWKDTYSVGDPLIDGQHKAMADLLNSLHAAVLQGKKPAVTAGILHGLVAQSDAHFSTEERLLIEKGYPDFKAHKAEHERLTAELGKFQQGVADGTIPLTLDLMEFLKGWLSKHILESDQEYIPFL